MLIPIGTEEAQRRRRFPFVTLAIVAINVVVFFAELQALAVSGDAGLEDFIRTYGLIPADVVHGRSLSTLFTSMFVHGGFAHITFNMVFLLAFGDNVEDLLGHVRYIMFYFLCGLGAAALQIAMDPASTLPNVGASGAIAGVLSGYLLLIPNGVVRVFVLFGLFAQVARLPAILFIGFWFLMQFFSGIASLGVQTAQTGGVAYWAHVGGFITGLVLALLLRQPRRERLLQ